MASPEPEQIVLTPEQNAALKQIRKLRRDGTLADQYFKAMASQMNQMIDTGIIILNENRVPTGINPDLLTDEILEFDPKLADLTTLKIISAFLLYSQINIVYSGTEADRTPRATINNFVSQGE